jgi:hypothetical protein
MTQIQKQFLRCEKHYAFFLVRKGAVKLRNHYILLFLIRCKKGKKHISFLALSKVTIIIKYRLHFN